VKGLVAAGNAAFCVRRPQVGELNRERNGEERCGNNGAKVRDDDADNAGDT
jgi:hypothetical protein